MQLVFFDALPVFRRDDMAERIGEIVLHHLRHAGRAGGEVHEHGVVPARGLCACGTLESIGMRLKRVVQVEPARAVVDDHDLVFERRHVAFSRLDLVDDERVVDADDRLHRGRIAAVDDILLRELQRTRDQDCAELVQRRRADPVFPCLLYTSDAADE